MAKINLRLAELRKRKGITQQEIANVLNVSYKTISKWENGGSMPDITMLPTLAEYFQVSVDQLLGVVPLEEEEYVPRRTGTGAFWEEKLEYLLRSRKNSWNLDYVEFLVRKVWKIDQPVRVLDCGCGYGFLGLQLLPFLPEGSTYTGIDFAEKLLEQGKLIFASRNMQAEFIQKNVYDYQVKNKYDLVICQAVLRHLDSPESFVEKMMEFAKPGAYIICIDSNREFECDGLYVDGMDYAELCRHGGLEKHWQAELTNQGRDYAAAIRTAHTMRKLGLQDIGVRMNDRVEFVTPQSSEYEQTKQDFIQYNDWCTGMSHAERDKVIKSFMASGAKREEAEEYCDRNIKIAEFFKENPSAGYTFVKGTIISYGKKAGITD